MQNQLECRESYEATYLKPKSRRQVKHQDFSAFAMLQG